MKNQSVNYLTTILNNIDSRLSDIATSINALSADRWQKYGVIASVLLAFIALYAANKDYYHSWFSRPKILVDEHVLYLKQNALLIPRLTITNSKTTVAKNVTIWIDKLWYFESDHWKEATNFLQFPLRWTYTVLDKEYKDLFYARPYYLDLCYVKCDENDKGMCEIYLGTLYTGDSGPKVHGLDDLKIGKNKLHMTVYCDNCSSAGYFIEIEWKGSPDYPKVQFIKNK